MIYAWERGDHDLSERCELLYRALGLGAREHVGGTTAAGHGMLSRARLDTLSAGQLDELIRLLDDQWHVLSGQITSSARDMPSAASAGSSP
jgi:hypothetical protein